MRRFTIWTMAGGFLAMSGAASYAAGPAAGIIVFLMLAFVFYLVVTEMI